MRKNINIAVDGPAASGKGTASKRVASKLGLIYLDTGIMYRALTWKAIERNVEFKRPEEIILLAKKININIKSLPDNSNQAFVDEIEVTQDIRSPAVNNKVSVVAEIPEVRKILVAKQQEMAKQGKVIMDGRDIGTNVLPDADLKFFITASLDERARRRYLEYKEKGNCVSPEEVLQEISLRDEIDSKRKADPLIVAKDAIVIDTTHMSIEEVVEKLIQNFQRRKK